MSLGVLGGTASGVQTALNVLLSSQVTQEEQECVADVQYFEIYTVTWISGSTECLNVLGI